MTFITIEMPGKANIGNIYSKDISHVSFEQQKKIANQMAIHSILYNEHI